MQVFYIAVILAFVPALLLMYLLLRPYTYPATEYPYFSDPSFFILFTVGLIAGTIMFLVYSFIANSFVSVLAYAVLQVLVVTVVMNLRRYRGKSDSIFYGFGFGLGAGATTGTGLIYWFGNSASYFGGALGVADYALLFILSLAMVNQFSAVGITVGDGIARHNPMQFAIQAMIYNIIFWVVFYIALINSDSTIYLTAAAAMCYVISLAYLLYASKKEIVTMVKEVDRMNKKGKKSEN